MSLFGTNIKKIRQIRGMSQKAFADLFKLNRGVIGAYEEGRSEPKIETLLTVAHHFNLDLDKFLTEPLQIDDLEDKEREEEVPAEKNLKSDTEPVQDYKHTDSNNSLQKALANIDLVYEFTNNTSLLSTYTAGDFLFLAECHLSDENPETLLFLEEGNLKHLSSVSEKERTGKKVYKIAGYLSANKKNILSNILERLEILETKNKV